MSDLERRIRILRKHGAVGNTLNELLQYNANHFKQAARFAARSYPLPDEEFVSTWIGYARHAEAGKVFAFLKGRLTQLNFPIQNGISGSDDYAAVNWRGEPVESAKTATGLLLDRPSELAIEVYQTAAGKIPILYTPHRPDFISLVRALTMRNEPLPIAESMGACIVSGYNNWDRIRAHRVVWERDTALTGSSRSLDSEWKVEFSRLLPRKHLYQDRFLLLSGGNYSGVAAAALGLSDDEWRAKSLVIRREHECTHYFTRRVFSSMRNHLLDELIADYSGVVAATGRFRADWVLRFMGLENFPAYRSGGRLENYLGAPPISDAALRVLQAIFMTAAEALERFTDEHAALLSCPDFRPVMITTLSKLTLEDLAGDACQDRLARNLQQSLGQFEIATFMEVS